MALGSLLSIAGIDAGPAWHSAAAGEALKEESSRADCVWIAELQLNLANNQRCIKVAIITGPTRLVELLFSLRNKRASHENVVMPHLFSI